MTQAPFLDKFRNKQPNIDPESLIPFFHGQNHSYRKLIFDLITENPQNFPHPHFAGKNTDIRHEAYKSLRYLFVYLRKNINYELYKKNPNAFTAVTQALYCFSPDLCIKFGVHSGLYLRTIFNLGTEKHQQFVERGTQKFEDFGCFALTELGHGSNVKDILTTATYDQQTHEFVINSNGDLGMKWWIGAAAQIANMAVVWAQLNVGDQCYGVTAFLVQIRDRKQYLPTPGVMIGDCGLKNGLNGVDNGFLKFQNVRIPYDNMLDRFCQIKDGKFQSLIEDDTKRFAFQLGSLSGGRASIPGNTTQHAILAITIGLRYSFVRKQFSNPGEEEIAIIEYPLTQYRLIPLLSRTIVQLVASQELSRFFDSKVHQMLDIENQKFVDEVHALTSIMKAKCSWWTAEVIQAAREILGGHGYSAVNRLGFLYADNDINITFEGDNHILIQQTSKFLMEGMSQLLKKKPVKYDSLKFLTLTPVLGQQMEFKDINELHNDLSILVNAFQWKTLLYLQKSGLKLKENLGKCESLFDTWNATQPFYLQEAAHAFGEYYMAQIMRDQIQQITHEQNKKLMTQIFVLWSLSSIIRDLGTFREGDYIDTEQAQIFKDHIMDLCKEIKSYCIDLTDVLAPPDYIIGSPLGNRNGDIYNNYLQRIYASDGTFERIKWCDEIKPPDLEELDKQDLLNKSKL